jgi:hypothetical protein
MIASFRLEVRQAAQRSGRSFFVDEDMLDPAVPQEKARPFQPGLSGQIALALPSGQRFTLLIFDFGFGFG